MKISAGLLLFLALLIYVPTYPLYAKESSSSSLPRVAQLKQELRTVRLEDRKEMMASREAAFKASLQKIKDQRKANLLNQLNTNLNQLNQTLTTQMLKHLDQMTGILSRVENIINNPNNSGKDLTSAKASIDAAKKAIADAKTAVENQQANDYTLNISNTTSLKADVQTTRDQLRTDLKTAKDLVVVARQAVANAIQTTAKAVGGNNGTN